MSGTRNLLFLLAYPLVIFGFYVGPLRTDQLLIIYLALVTFSMHSAYSFRLKEFFVISMIILFITVGIISSREIGKPKDILLAVSQLQNYTELLLVYLIWTNFFKHQSNNFLIRGQKFFIYAIALVTLLNVYAKFFGPGILSIFHNSIVTQKVDDENNIGKALLDLVTDSGRYPGTFGQVFEAGISYSLAFLSIVLLKKYYTNKILYYFLLALIIGGGFLTGSKVFLVSFLLICLSRALKSVSLLLLTIILSATFVIFISIYGIDILPWQFRRLLNELTWQTFFHVYTSFRFYENSLIVSGMQDIMSKSAFSGMGFGYLDNSDFSLYEVLSIAGLFGIFLYAIIIIFIYSEIKLANNLWYTFYIYFFITTASISAPAITGNKICFIILVTFLSIAKIRGKNENSYIR